MHLSSPTHHTNSFICPCISSSFAMTFMLPSPHYTTTTLYFTILHYTSPLLHLIISFHYLSYYIDSLSLSFPYPTISLYDNFKVHSGTTGKGTRWSADWFASADVKLRTEMSLLACRQSKVFQFGRQRRITNHTDGCLFRSSDWSPCHPKQGQ
jgi:hypothetical protein